MIKTLTVRYASTSRTWSVQMLFTEDDKTTIFQWWRQTDSAVWLDITGKQAGERRSAMCDRAVHLHCDLMTEEQKK